MRNPELWRRVREFRFDDGAPRLSFAKRLARENGWSPAFAERVVEEYRRFVYLAMVSGHVVTPSDHVDQAWHLHLVYTRSYWDGLCKGVLGQPLHHDPTKGGEKESHKFEDFYERTLATYEAEFGEAAPVDIWPDARDRFDHDAHARRVNTLDHWVIPKRRARSVLVMGAALAAAAVASITAGCAVKPTNAGLSREAIVLLGLGAVIVLILVLVWAFRRRNGESGSGCSSGGCAVGSGCGGHRSADDGGDGGGDGGVDGGGDGGSGCGSGCGGGCGGGD
ncbi:MAG: hypothetical protein ACOYN0_04435 [Phycisphaerales bacterium]